MPYYEIKNWDRIFENAESRKCKKLNWVPIPNKWDGLGFSRLRKHKNFVVAFAGWSLITQIASKMPQRGILVTADGWELSPVDMADLTGCPEDVFSKALEVLCAPEIGWIIRKDSENLPERPDAPEDNPDTSGQTPGTSGQTPVEQKGTEQKEKKGDEASPPTRKKGFKVWTLEEFKTDTEKAAAERRMPNEMKWDFLNYWTEKSSSGLMKFQLQPTWETGLRITTWIRNQAKFDVKPGFQRQEPGFKSYAEAHPEQIRPKEKPRKVEDPISEEERKEILQRTLKEMAK